MALAGDALHWRREERSEQLLTGAVIAAGLPEQLLAVALRPSIEQGLIAEHDQALDELGALAFPSIELDRERKHRAEPFGLSDVHLAIDSARKSIRAAEFSRCNV